MSKVGHQFEFLDLLMESIGSIFGRIFLYFFAIIIAGGVGGLTGGPFGFEAIGKGVASLKL